MPDSITVSYDFKGGTKGEMVTKYSIENSKISYEGFNNLHLDENQFILNAKVAPSKTYFEEMEKTNAPQTVNSVGLTIKKSNTLNFDETYRGLFGRLNFDEDKNCYKQITHHFDIAALKKSIYTNNELVISQLEYEAVLLKATTIKNIKSIFPIVKTDYSINIVNHEINEWENVLNLEAVISCTGRGIFDFSYFATDYAEHREFYLSKKKCKLKVSGIIFILDDGSFNNIYGEVPLSNNFTGFKSTAELPNAAFFDFIGVLETFRETSLLVDNSLKGYILKIKMIADENVKDFFTIDVFVTHENMRFSELAIGIKL